MIKIRKLLNKDIPFMIEWMNYEETKLIFKNDFSSIDEISLKTFIDTSFTQINQHFAIVDDSNDEYLGTISLKNIDYINKNAEYAISTRRKAWGTRVNIEATQLIIKYGFTKLELHKIYLNVIDTNERAINFYKKNGFVYEGTFRNHIKINGEFKNLEWYGLINE